MKLFGVWYEYGRDGSQKSGIIPKEKNKQPKKAIKRIKPHCCAYEFWFHSESLAKEIKANIDMVVKNKRDMANFFAGYTADVAEKRAAA
jgi:hypothetical protein